MRAPEQQLLLKHAGSSAGDPVDHAGGPSATAAAVQLQRRLDELAAKEEQLAALSATIDAAESAILEAQSHGSTVGNLQAACGDANTGAAAAAAAAVGATDSALAIRWSSLAARRSELVCRWQCLLEERRAVRLLAQAAHGGGELLRGCAASTWARDDSAAALRVRAARRWVPACMRRWRILAWRPHTTPPHSLLPCRRQRV